MNVLITCLIVLSVSGAAVAIMLVLRRRAPAGGYFSDPERAAGVFSALATAFSVLLAFVIFITFQDYDEAKMAAEEEALAVTEQFEAAELFAPATRDTLQGELLCYARAVIEDEWPLMRGEERSERVDDWVFTIDRDFDAASPGTFQQRTAFEKWFDETTAREKGRAARLLEAGGVVPPPVWIVLLLGAVLVVGYLLFYADSGERRRAQAVQIGTVTALVTTSLLVVNFFDHPYEDRSGSIRPEAMEFTLQILSDEEASRHPRAEPPCDQEGRPN